MKKTLFWMSALLLMLLLAACSSGNNASVDAPPEVEQENNVKNEASEEGAGSQPPAEETASDELIEIDWLSFDYPSEDGSLAQQFLEERFHVKINNIRIDRANWRDQLNLRLASGDLPDLWLLWGIADVSAYAQQGLLLELPIEEIKQHLPEYGAFIDEHDPAAWTNGMIDGKSYGIPIVNLDGRFPLLTFYNQEWLTAIGYDEPPATLAELEDVMVKFRNNDPDGNGLRDTYGMTGRGAANVRDSFYNVFGAFDVQPEYWVLDEAGNLQFGMTTENAREAFKVLNNWFEQELIDPEFITADGSQQEYENGKVGMTLGPWYYRSPSREASLLETDSKYFASVPGTQVAASGYTGKATAWGMSSNYFGMGVDVAEHPGKKEKIYEILQAIYTDQEVIVMLTRGQEGVHHEVLEDGFRATKPEWTSSALTQIGIGNYYGLLSRRSLLSEAMLTPQADLQWRDEVTSGISMILDEANFYLPSRSNYPDLVNLQKEYFIKMITGDVDLADGFDDFVARWNNAGGRVLTEEANAIYRQNQGL